MKTSWLVRIVSLMLVLLLAPTFLPRGLAQAQSVNPLLDPQPLRGYTSTRHQFFNMLLVGIDYGLEGQWGSGNKQVLEECHADAIMLVSVNRTLRQIHLISIPRDTLVYVPGVRGIYKINAAINCAKDLEQGMERICDAVSWLLGGIKINKYVALDMSAMIHLGDLIGGVDFDLEMSYTGSSGRGYSAGRQHLDGQGIMDYVRARRNATMNGTDLGRTNRQRDMMLAILQKLRGQLSLINKVYSEIQNNKELNVFRNVHRTDLNLLLPILKTAKGEDLGSHVLTGSYRTALGGWNFTFTNDQERKALIKQVYGLDAESLPFVDYPYTEWLMSSGMVSVRQILLTRQIMAYGAGLENPTQQQLDMLEELTQAHDAAVAAFDKACVSLGVGDSGKLSLARADMKEKAIRAAGIFDYPDSILWSGRGEWQNDTLVNEYSINWN